MWVADVGLTDGNRVCGARVWGFIFTVCQISTVKGKFLHSHRILIHINLAISCWERFLIYPFLPHSCVHRISTEFLGKILNLRYVIAFLCT